MTKKEQDAIQQAKDLLAKAGIDPGEVAKGLAAEQREAEKAEREARRKAREAEKAAREKAEKALSGKLDQIGKIVKAAGLVDCTVRIVVGPDGAIVKAQTGPTRSGGGRGNGQHLTPEAFKAIVKAHKAGESPKKTKGGLFKLGDSEFTATVLIEAACEMAPDKDPTPSVAKEIWGEAFSAGQYNGATRRWGENGLRKDFRAFLKSDKKPDKK